LHILKYLSLLLLITVFFISCEKDDSSIIDPVLHFPNIDSAFVTPNVFDTSTVYCIAIAVVTSEEAINRVTAKVKNPDGQELLTIDLFDNGVFPDTTAGDKRYTGQISLNLPCRLIGTYNVEFLAENISHLFSPSITRSFSIIQTYFDNPVISDLIISDSLQRPISGFNVGFLQVKALDANGQCDIRHVYFRTIRPDGTTNGLTFYMYDDGNILEHCDTVANDTKYSLCINIDNTAQIGYYKFIFNAVDRSDSLSNTLRDSIYVYP
jgi:hypothetical protein